MKKLNSRLKGGYAAIISAVLLSSVLFVGFTGNNGTATLAYGSMMEDKGNDDSMMEGDKMSDDSIMMDDKTKMRHTLKGQISNVQLDSAGMPEWIQFGFWVLKATIDENSEPQSIQFVAKFSMVMPDGTAMHAHTIYGFKPAEFMTEQNDTIQILEGTATVTMRDGPVADVPLTIKVFNRSVVGLWIGPDKVDRHFGSNPIYGILSTGSKGIMAEMGSMMDGDHGGNMMGNSMEQTLTKTNLPVTLPLTRGFADGNEVFYISTEASDAGLADHLTNITGSRVVFAPSLARAPSASLSNIYAFENGIEGTGPLGFQPNVADSQPGDEQYSPLWRIILVKWSEGVTATELKSEQEILAAQQEGKLAINVTTMVVNCPFVQWEGDSLMVRSDKTLNDDTAYGGGQVLQIDTENMTVTFVAHRGFAPDGSTIYYIATDASNPDAADALEVTFVSKTGGTNLSGASSDLYVFTNGIRGTGPMGFQASIAGSDVGDNAYSPLWRINAATWEDPSKAKFLNTVTEISAAASNGMLATELAGFVVNCPFVEVDDA